MKKLLLFVFLTVFLSGCHSSEKTKSEVKEVSYEVVMYTSIPYSNGETQIYNSEEHIESFKEKPNASNILATYIKRYLNTDSDDSVTTFTYNSITIDDHNMVHIDLSQKTFELITVGSFMETSVLEGISKTILVNDPSVYSITYTIDQQPYESSQYSIPLGSPFKTRDDY